METLEQLRQQLTNDLKNSFLKRASDTDSNRKPLDVIGEVSLMLATNIADYSEKLLREIVTPGYVTDEYDKRYTLLTTFNAHESNLRDAKHITKEQLDVINLVTSWFGFDPDENAVYVKNKYNFYAEGGVSAKGFSAGGSGGGGGMDEELLWSILGDGDNPNKQIALSHLDTLLKNINNTYYTKQQIQANYLTASEISAKYISKEAFPKIFSDEMAKWFKKDEDGNIYAEVNFYSTQGISAKGLGSGSGGGGGMDEELLWAILGDGENPDKQIAISHLSTALSNYATHTWVTDKHYATEAWVTAKKYATIDWVNETFVKKADYTDLWLAEMDKWFKKDDSGNIYTEVNFYSNKGVSAKGLDASGGGGGGMDEELLWSILGDGENPNKQIALTHLTTALSGYYTSTQVNSAINDAVKYYIPTSQKGVAGGVAPLGSDGLISSSFLPSYVDDVLEFASLSAFPSTGESGKIYIAVDTNLTYRWSGTQYVEVSKSLALGETESTAYAGNKGAANRADIDKLKRATFWGASYQSDGNVYGTFTGTKIILSDLIETPKIKIGDAFIEYDAERTALKVVRYLADGTETVASLYATGGISARGFSPSGGGGGGGAGSISLNGTLYESVDGVITLPNLKLAEPTTFTLHENYVSVRTAGRTSNQYYEFWDTDAGWAILAAKGFKTPEGTSSQFLKADGSKDGNLYALAYNNNQNKVLESNVSNSLHVIDRRNDTILPSSLDYYSISTFFRAGGNMPDGNWWSGIHVKGWGDGYCAWELAGPSSTNNTAYNLRYRTGIGDTWGDWKMIMTDVECDKNYVKKAGDTMTGRLTAPFFRANNMISVGVPVEQLSSSRAELNIITLTNNPCDIWMGANNQRYWSITARDSTENYQLGIYNSKVSSWNAIFRDNINDFYVKTEVRDTFLVLPTTGGGYNEGIRIGNASNGWSNVQFGSQNAWNGKVDGQWLIGRNPVKYFQICLAGTETANTSKPGKGISIDINGYLDTGYIRPNIDTEYKATYFYASDDSFIRRTTWDYALNCLNQNQLTLDLSSLDSNKWYPCTINAPAYGGTPLRITIFNGLRGNKPSWASHNSGFSLLLDYYVTGSGWGTLSAVSKLDWYHGSYGGETAFGGRQQNTMGSAEIVYLRGGGVYYYRTTNHGKLNVHPNGYSWANGSYTYSAAVKTSQDNSPIDKTFDQVYWAPVNLRTTRTLWGQPFNGNQDVSGALQNVTTINASSTIYTGGDIIAYSRLFCGGYLYVHRNAYSGSAAPAISLAIGDTDTGFNWDHDGVINFVSNATNAGYWGSTDARFHNAYFRIPSGNDYSQLGIMVNGNGTSNTIKPGIGFHQPGVFAGSIRMNDGSTFGLYAQGGSGLANLSLNGWYTNYGYINGNGLYLTSGWFRAHGATGWYNQTYGGGMYMTDTVYVRTYNNKSLKASTLALGDRDNDNSARYISCYGKADVSYINFGYTPGGGNCGELSFAYTASSGPSNYIGLGFYGGSGANLKLYYNNSSILIGSLSVNGNIVATGGVTAKSTSDIRLKIKLESPKSYKERILELGPVFDYQFNSLAKSRVGKNADSLNHIGLGYQTAKVSMPVITGLDEDGYGYINYIHPDLIALSIGAIQEIISEEYTIKKDIDSLKNRVRQLEAENKQLKERLGLIA
jgi:hypothetical protein|uniref:Tail protein n=1 Tax=Myoviridae sp. ctByu2 TaxID=2827668 RepID=A0A8S5S9T7_9CAUD|nr:MAG TPA: tail protein [Myoviridae sp. ctByu2]